jgi:streptogramin lyase
MGSGGDIVALTTDGKEVKRFKKVIEQTSLKRASLENITLDGEGNIYVVDRMGYYILKFSKDGKYINRFGGKNESGRKDVKGSLDASINDIAIDGKGNLFVSMVNNILVFDTNGAYVDSFDTRQAFGMTVTDKNELWVACRPFVVKYEAKTSE